MNLRVNDSQLTSIANAIRTKSGGSSNLTFPDGFVSAINGIQVGLEYTDNGFTTDALGKQVTSSTVFAKDEKIFTWTYSTSPAKKIAVNPDTENTVVQARWQAGSWGNASDSYYAVINVETINTIRIIKSVEFYAKKQISFGLNGMLSLRANIPSRVITAT